MYLHSCVSFCISVFLFWKTNGFFFMSNLGLLEITEWEPWSKQVFILQAKPPALAVVLPSVSNSGQKFKTRVSGSWEKKSGKIQVLKWMRFWVIKTQPMSLWNYHRWSLRNSGTGNGVNFGNLAILKLVGHFVRVVWPKIFCVNRFWVSIL